jgi:hypothetical protein
MSSELRSTARPTGLRLAGFLCVILGALAVGLGATREWVTLGFAADLEGAADVHVFGTDVWEGKVVLFAALAAGGVLLALRLTTSPATRRTLAILLIVLGAACIALPVLDAIRAEDRFGSREGIERVVRDLAATLELPEDVVRDQLLEQLERDLTVEIASGLWLTAAGGILLVAGGVLSLAWARRQDDAGSPGA